MVKIRLRRMGAKKQPMYRIVVADSRSPRDGRYIESIGYYNPLTEPATIVLDTEKASKWISQGAQPTLIVKKLMKRAGAGQQADVAPEPVSVAPERAPAAPEVVTQEPASAEPAAAEPLS